MDLSTQFKQMHFEVKFPSYQTCQKRCMMQKEPVDRGLMCHAMTHLSNTNILYNQIICWLFPNDLFSSTGFGEEQFFAGVSLEFTECLTYKCHIKEGLIAMFRMCKITKHIRLTITIYIQNVLSIYTHIITEHADCEEVDICTPQLRILN